jgi:PAS domain S-box-containing protein
VNAVLDPYLEIPFAIAVLDRDGHTLISVNSAMCRLMDWDARAVQGKAAQELWQWEPPSDIPTLLKRLALGEQCPEYWTMPIARGQTRHMVVQSSPLSVGDTEYLLVSFTDVSKTVGSLRTAQSREGLLRRALKSSAVAAWEWDFAKRCFTLNERLEHPAVHDLAAPPITGSAFSELLHPDDRSMLTNAMDRHLQRNEPYSVEVRLRNAAGSYRWVQLRGEAERDPDGTPVRMAGTLDDVTDKREADMVRRRIQERLAIATSTVGISTWEVLPNGTAIWDAQTYRLYGRDPSTQLAPLAIYRESLSVQELARTHQWMVETMRSHTYSTIEFQLTWPSGEVRWLAAKGKGLTGPDGKVVSLLGVNWDITEQKRAAQALMRYQQELLLLTQTLMEQEKQTSQRLAMALHDRLGQSLAALRLNIDALQLLASDQPATVAHTRRMQVLMDGATQELREVLMDLRPPILEEQGLGPAMENEIVASGTRLTQPVIELRASRQAMQKRLPPAVEYGCFMIYREAMANSLKHAHAASITVELQHRSDGMHLTITDDGIGMDLSHSAIRAGHLGLVGMRERAIAMGATLTVTSTLGGGTRTMVRYPAVI